ncbi:MAG: S8 family serine peptidase, partial [Ignavibacteriae bacterium]|nr:S8 family serine peptidase [Ignavibacteriota bacterium]
MKNMLAFTFIILMLCSSMLYAQQSVVSEELRSAMVNASEAEMIEVLIFFKDTKTFTPQEKSIAVTESLSSWLTYHARALKEFGNSKSANARAIVSSAERNGKAKLVNDLWVANAISCRATKDIIALLAHLPDVKKIKLDKILKVGSSSSYSNNAVSEKGKKFLGNSVSVPEWGVDSIKAPLVWNMGYNGQNVLIAVLDDGFNYNHPDLKDHMWNGSNFTYDGQQLLYHGWDVVNKAYDPPDNNPIDGGGHGTRTAGIIVGDGTRGKQTGVAPGAKLLLIRVWENIGTLQTQESWFLDGIQWFFNMKLQNPTFIYPDMINISGGIEFGEKPDYEIWRDLCYQVYNAGVLIVSAAGNLGTYAATSLGCIDSGNQETLSCPFSSMIGAPCGRGIPYNIEVPAIIPSPWIHPNQLPPLQTGADDAGKNSVLAVGAIGQSNIIENYSARGPARWGDIQSLYSCQEPIASKYWDYPYSP